MITVIDSGIANIGSVQAACRRIGVDTLVTTEPAAVRSASALILPGVGAFANGMESLRRHRLIEPITEAAARGTPILGICLGMQLLAQVSEEFGVHEGIALIRGRVTRLNATHPGERVPNIGWCDVAVRGRARLLQGVEDGAAFYFVHSYSLHCADPEDCAGIIKFGAKTVCAVVERGNIFGAQFHPEKSQAPGLQFLDNFARLTQERYAA